jgi:hypothetical protein
MSESFGAGVSRTLSALQRQFSNVVFQKGKPPLDSELNLQDSIHTEQLAQALQAQVHSGFLVDPTQTTADFVVDPHYSNCFFLGQAAAGEEAPVQWALVNGWVVPVTGTHVDATNNLITLYPPPATGTRIDFVFLEVWATLIAPNPSEENKPSASTIWRYGNVEYGGTNITDDLVDPTLLFETTERVQVQYRLRVFGQGAGLGSSVALDVYPEGLDDPNVLGQGTATSPVAGLTWTNMREALGDPSLWRAGDGDPSNGLGTVDGFTYAVPVCAIFRRNSDPFAAITSSGMANLNGGLDRNPSAASLTNPRDGAKTLSVPTLTTAISKSATGAIAITGLADSGFDDPDIDLASTFLQVGDEVMGPITAVGASTITVSQRGRNATVATQHAAGTPVRFFNPRADGLFADQIVSTDILDMRHGTGMAWDYQQVLIHNLSKLVRRDLRTSYKQSSAGNTQGLLVQEVSFLSTSAPPSGTVAVDGPDGIRTVFSDAAALQPHTTLLCAAPTVAGAAAALDTGVVWDVAADFKPSGFITGAGYANGTTIFLNIGGADGNSGARGTFRTAGTRAVRFVAPNEYWKDSIPTPETGNQTPVRIRFLEAAALQPAAEGEGVSDHPGPMYPTAATNFEKPYIVLGGVLNAASSISGAQPDNDSPAAAEFEIDLPGLDFDLAGGWYPDGDVHSLSTDGVTFPVLRGERTLYDMLTQGGQDETGSSSEVYLILYGDSTNPENNGAFQVIGAGTVDYTSANASTASRVRVRALTQGWSGFTLPVVGTLTAEIRSQYTNAEDGAGGSAAAPASLAVVWTDIEGAAPGSLWPGALTEPVSQKMVISTTLQYHPGRGAAARVPDDIWRVNGLSLGAEYLREAPGSVDVTFPAAAGTPANETFFSADTQVQTWNRLPSLGLTAPDAPSYGGGIAAWSEQTRENEAFLDRGSKTLILRPFLDRAMTLQARTSTAAVGDTLLGPTTYLSGTVKDGAAIWTTGLHMGFEVPPEYMPRFGRQDIPYRVNSNSSFLPGINHLFTDSTDVTEAQFYIIGGQDSTSTTIRPMYLQTGASSGYDYCEYGTITGPGTPAYQAQLINIPEVISSDLGRGMKGIQLPPYLGVARLYGVYDRRDFIAKGGATFNANRVTPASDPATNLLARVDKQTLFILQSGGFAVTGDTGDHTYIIPSDAIDITLSPNYTAGETFEDIEYVVEFCCFGFARGFIHDNNYVLCRRHKGSSTLIVDGDDPEAAGARMTLPAAAPAGDQIYIGYSRVPYQGDPYMTRAGSVRVTSDYEVRYGQIPVAGQFALTSSIQQYDSAGVQIPQTPNVRALEVLASLDFYTTLGTGKIGGDMYTGTSLDVGYTAPAGDTRLPASGSAPAWRVLPRALTAGQDPNIATSALLTLVVADNNEVGSTSITISVPDQNDVVLTEGSEFVVEANSSLTAEAIVNAINSESALTPFIQATNNGDAGIHFMSLVPGAAGNRIKLSVSSAVAYRFQGVRGTRTSAYLAGGRDVPMNAGSGSSQLDLTGSTEMFPLGILLQDSDFLCENPLGGNASAMVSFPAGINPVQSLLPLGSGGSEYTRLTGGAGQWLALSDGGVLEYTAYNEDTAPSGTRKFRLYRGGGATSVVSDPVPGGPVDWVAGSWPASVAPVLKGGVLICKAMLVRNLPEQVFSSQVTEGDEIQMVILTYGHIGVSPGEELTLAGVLSPTGYGEGYAAADRYRIEGRLMTMGRRRLQENTDVSPAVYPGTGAEPL